MLFRSEQGLAVNIDPAKLISLSSECKCLMELRSELSAPRRMYTDNGKILVESKKAMKLRRISSPNLSDALIISLSENRMVMNEANSFEPNFRI